MRRFHSGYVTALRPSSSIRPINRSGLVNRNYQNLFLLGGSIIASTYYCFKIGEREHIRRRNLEDKKQLETKNAKDEFNRRHDLYSFSIPVEHQHMDDWVCLYVPKDLTEEEKVDYVDLHLGKGRWLQPVFKI